MRVLHDERLALRIATRPKPAQDAPVTEIEDLRRPAGGEELRLRGKHTPVGCSPESKAES